MKSIVITANYKGVSNATFQYGKGYTLAVVDGMSVCRLMVGHKKITVDSPAVEYKSIVDFLSDWSNIETYPTLETKTIHENNQ